MIAFSITLRVEMKYILIHKIPFLLIMPLRRRRASKFTIIGVFVVDRQCGKIHAFRYLEYRAAWKSGFGSTRSPDHWKEEHDKCWSYLRYTTILQHTTPLPWFRCNNSNFNVIPHGVFQSIMSLISFHRLLRRLQCKNHFGAYICLIFLVSRQHHSKSPTRIISIIWAGY